MIWIMIRLLAHRWMNPGLAISTPHGDEMLVRAVPLRSWRIARLLERSLLAIGGDQASGRCHRWRPSVVPGEVGALVDSYVPGVLTEPFVRLLVAVLVPH